MNWRLRLWAALLLSVLSGVLVSVGVTAAHYYGTTPVVDSTIVWEGGR